MNFSASVTVPQTRPDQERELWEQLIQDGFSPDEVHVPPLASPEFSSLLNDARSYSAEIKNQPATAWDMRCVRWLNRISTVLTGKIFTELPITKRRGICHAAIVLAACPELLP